MSRINVKSLRSQFESNNASRAQEPRKNFSRSHTSYELVKNQNVDLNKIPLDRQFSDPTKRIKRTPAFRCERTNKDNLAQKIRHFENNSSQFENNCHMENIRHFENNSHVNSSKYFENNSSHFENHNYRAENSKNVDSKNSHLKNNSNFENKSSYFENVTKTNDLKSNCSDSLYNNSNASHKSTKISSPKTQISPTVSKNIKSPNDKNCTPQKDEDHLNLNHIKQNLFKIEKNLNRNIITPNSNNSSSNIFLNNDNHSFKNHVLHYDSHLKKPTPNKTELPLYSIPNKNKHQKELSNQYSLVQKPDIVPNIEYKNNLDNKNIYRMKKSLTDINLNRKCNEQQDNSGKYLKESPLNISPTANHQINNAEKNEKILKLKSELNKKLYQYNKVFAQNELTNSLKKALNAPLPKGPPPKKPPRTFIHSSNNLEIVFDSRSPNMKPKSVENYEKCVDKKISDAKRMLDKLENVLISQKLKKEGKIVEKSINDENKLKNDINLFNDCFKNCHQASPSTSSNEYKEGLIQNSVFYTDTNFTTGRSIAKEPIYDEPFKVYVPENKVQNIDVVDSNQQKNDLHYCCTLLESIPDKDGDFFEKNKQSELNNKTLNDFKCQFQKKNNFESKLKSIHASDPDLIKSHSLTRTYSKVNKELINQASNNNPTSADNVKPLVNQLETTNSYFKNSLSNGNTFTLNSDTTKKYKSHVNRVSIALKRYKSENYHHLHPIMNLRSFQIGGKSTSYLFDCCFLIGLNMASKVPYFKFKIPNHIQMPPLIELLCFPDGNLWNRQNLNNQQTNNYDQTQDQEYRQIITDENGDKRYVYCRRVKPEGAHICLPLVYCILTSHRSSDFYFNILKELEQLHGLPDHVIFETIRNLYHNQFPKPGEMIKSKLMTELLNYETIKENNLNNLCANDTNLCDNKTVRNVKELTKQLNDLTKKYNDLNKCNDLVYLDTNQNYNDLNKPNESNNNNNETNMKFNVFDYKINLKNYNNDHMKYNDKFKMKQIHGNDNNISNNQIDLEMNDEKKIINKNEEEMCFVNTNNFYKSDRNLKKKRHEINRVSSFFRSNSSPLIKLSNRMTDDKCQILTAKKCEILNDNQIYLPCGKDVKYICVSRCLDSRLASIEMLVLLDALKVDVLLNVLASLLLERKVVFVSKSISKLSQCIEALENILYPFKWPYTLIVILPCTLIDILSAPTPYIIGIIQDAVDSKLHINHGIAVNLDTCEVICSMNDEFNILPNHIYKSLKSTLNSIKLTSTAKQSTFLRNMLISEAFIAAFVQIFGNYKQFFIENHNNKYTFNKEKFLRSNPSKSIQLFLEWFTDTVMFKTFIENYKNTKYSDDSNDEDILYFELFNNKIEQISKLLRKKTTFSNKLKMWAHLN